MKKIMLSVPLLGLLGVLLAGCNNTQTYASQCAYQIQNGYFDARHVKDILHPGERKNSNNVKTRYVYCNARNWIVSTARDATADQHSAVEARTGKNALGDGTPVLLEGSAHFTLNQNESTLLTFLGFCEKYSCFSDKDTSNNANEAHSSSPGWNDMLAENMRFAFQRATQVAMQKFAPNIWNDQSQWPKVSDAISAQMKIQLQSQIGTDQDFFCGTGVHLLSGHNESSTGAWTCPDISVTIDKIYPQDEAIRAIYNQQVEQQQQRLLALEQKKTNRAELDAAKVKYGSQAGYFLGMQDTCAKAQTCVINPPNTARP